MSDMKKFLDAEGVKHLWSKVNMQDYPNNETLMAVINAIDETKADKNELVQSDWDENDETSLAYIKNRTHYENILKEWVCFDEELEVINGSISRVIEYPIPEGTYIDLYVNDELLDSNRQGILYNDGTVRFYCLPGLYFWIDNNTLTMTVYNYEFYEVKRIKIVVKDLNAGVKKLDEKYIPWPDENDALELLGEVAMIEATAAADGSIYIEDTGVIYTL